MEQILQYDQKKQLIAKFQTIRQASKETGFNREEISRALYSTNHYLKLRHCFFSYQSRRIISNDQFHIGDKVIVDEFKYDRIAYTNFTAQITKIYENSICLDISEAKNIPDEIMYRLCKRIIVSKRSVVLKR
ncbi:hypothetical protein [Lentilactobacillus senioris]|uniref:hypothetical protein n=1 Tax=Lentilactobacillus senioris TaxID=931534 RepID=UPI003D265744